MFIKEQYISQQLMSDKQVVTVVLSMALSLGEAPLSSLKESQWSRTQASCGESLRSIKSIVFTKDLLV